jgi:hypothetical protein
MWPKIPAKNHRWGGERKCIPSTKRQKPAQARECVLGASLCRGFSFLANFKDQPELGSRDFCQVWLELLCLTSDWTGLSDSDRLEKVSVRHASLITGQTPQFEWLLTLPVWPVIGPARPTGLVELWLDPAKPIAGWTQKFKHYLNQCVRPLNAGSASLLCEWPLLPTLLCPYHLV